MAVLEDQGTGERHLLSPRHLLGRAPACQLRILEPQVSGFHMEVQWDGRSWLAQDLGSRNGSLIAGRTLRAGEQVALAVGDEILLAGRVHFRLVDDAPPELMASTPAGEVRVAKHSLLVLPSDEDPELTLYSDLSGNWVVESATGITVADEGQTLFAGGKAWRLSLPTCLPETRDYDGSQGIHGFVYSFEVSRDGEHIELTLKPEPRGGVTLTVEPRAHLALLYVLARLRVDDIRAGLPSSECGWVHREDLPKKLGVEPHMPNLWIHRARKQIAALGLRDAATVVERRARGTQLRIGAARIEISESGGLV